MYIACDDTSVIVINFRKSKTHARHVSGHKNSCAVLTAPIMAAEQVVPESAARKTRWMVQHEQNLPEVQYVSAIK